MDTLKLVYTQLEAFNLVDEYTEAYKNKIKELEEENKKLKSDLAFERTMLDNVRAEYKSLQNVNKKLKEERDEYYAEWHLRHS